MRERLGIVFAWYHADGLEPFYELTLLDEIAARRMHHVGDFEMPLWHMHIMEPAQNSNDWYGGHRSLTAPPRYWQRGVALH